VKGQSSKSPERALHEICDSRFHWAKNHPPQIRRADGRNDLSHACCAGERREASLAMKELAVNIEEEVPFQPGGNKRFAGGLVRELTGEPVVCELE
jgi:hypothetical protein